MRGSGWAQQRSIEATTAGEKVKLADGRWEYAAGQSRATRRAIEPSASACVRAAGSASVAAPAGRQVTTTAAAESREALAREPARGPEAGVFPVLRDSVPAVHGHQGRPSDRHRCGLPRLSLDLRLLGAAASIPVRSAGGAAWQPWAQELPAHRAERFGDVGASTPLGSPIRMAEVSACARRRNSAAQRRLVRAWPQDLRRPDCPRLAQPDPALAAMAPRLRGDDELLRSRSGISGRRAARPRPRAAAGRARPPWRCRTPPALRAAFRAA